MFKFMFFVLGFKLASVWN